MANTEPIPHRNGTPVPDMVFFNNGELLNATQMISDALSLSTSPMIYITLVVVILVALDMMPDLDFLYRSIVNLYRIIVKKNWAVNSFRALYAFAAVLIHWVTWASAFIGRLNFKSWMAFVPLYLSFSYAALSQNNASQILDMMISVAVTLVALDMMPELDFLYRSIVILYRIIVKKNWAVNSTFRALYAFAAVLIRWVTWASAFIGRLNFKSWMAFLKSFTGVLG